MATDSEVVNIRILDHQIWIYVSKRTLLDIFQIENFIKLEVDPSSTYASVICNNFNMRQKQKFCILSRCINLKPSSFSNDAYFYQSTIKSICCNRFGSGTELILFSKLFSEVSCRSFFQGVYEKVVKSYWSENFVQIGRSSDQPIQST